MARPKKDGRYVNFYMNNTVCDALTCFAEESGLTKTMVMEKAVKYYVESKHHMTMTDYIESRRKENG